MQKNKTCWVLRLEWHYQMTVAPGQRLNMDEDDDLQLLAEVVVAAAYMAWQAGPELYGKVRCQLPARLCLSAG